MIFCPDFDLLLEDNLMLDPGSHQGRGDAESEHRLLIGRGSSCQPLIGRWLSGVILSSLWLFGHPGQVSMDNGLWLEPWQEFWGLVWQIMSLIIGWEHDTGPFGD